MRYIEHNLLLETAQPWQIEQFGFDAHGKDNCLFISSIAAICYENYDMLRAVADCLLQRRRWPVELDQPEDKNYRSVKGMTRDPYIMFYCAAHLLNRRQFIDAVKMPWYLYRPNVWAWRRYLITGEEKYKRKYEFWQKISLRFKHPVYALNLAAWMAYVAESNEIKDELDDILYANGIVNHLLLELLICDTVNPWLAEVDQYQPRIRFYWTAEPWEAEQLPLYDGPYAIDKDILYYLINRQTQPQ